MLKYRKYDYKQYLDLCTTSQMNQFRVIRGRQLHKNAASNIEQVLEATPHKAPTIRPPTSHHENYPS